MKQDSNAAGADVADVIALDVRARRRRQIVWISFGVIIVLAIAAMVVRSRIEIANRVDFDKIAAQQGELQVTVTATGKLEPTDQVDVGSEISGRIAEINVDFNDKVTRGEVLATIDTEQLEAMVAQRKAQLTVAQASLKQAEATAKEQEAQAKRSRELVKNGFLSEQGVESAVAAADRARAAVASAKAQVVVAQASLQNDETSLKKAVIRSPIDGVVISREVDVGQTIAATFQAPLLFKLAKDLTHMQLHLNIDEADIGLVREGQEAVFSVDAFPNKDFEATIVSVRYAPKDQNNVVTYEAVLSVDNPDLLLRPGMTATAQIIAQKKDNVLMVPNRALRFTPPKQGFGGEVADLNTQWNLNKDKQVWVMNKDKKPEAIKVKVGLSNDQWTEVTEGDVKPGMELLVAVADKNKG